MSKIYIFIVRLYASWRLQFSYKMRITLLSTAKSSQTNKAQSYTRQIYGVGKYLLNAVNIAHTHTSFGHIIHKYQRKNSMSFGQRKLLSFLIKWQVYHWPRFMIWSLLFFLLTTSLVCSFVLYGVILAYLWGLKTVDVFYWQNSHNPECKNKKAFM